MNNSNALAEIQSKYPNCNLLLPAATSVQINPFYKCSVMEVVADTAPNSGDIFSVGKVKTGEDGKGKAIYEDVFSPAKPLLMKLATAAGIQFHPEYTTVTRENTNTYVGKAYGAVRLPDGSYKTHMETKRICLDDEESKYRLEFMDKSIMGIHDWRAAKAASEMFKGEWKDDPEKINQWGKPEKYYVIADSDREKYIERSILVNMTLLRKTASEKAQTGAILRVIRALLGIKGTYSKAELEKPFVVPTVTFAPDYTDPTVRSAMLQQGMNSMGNMFGASSTPPAISTAFSGEAFSSDFNPEDEIDNPAFASEQAEDSDVRLNLMAKKDYSIEPAADNSDNVFVLEEPMLNETGNTLVYPFGFEPTYHKYRMDYPEKLKMGNNIFVGAMADIFGKWVPDEWIRDVMETCLDNPIHNYLFLTKNPERYTEVGVPAGLENMWYGTTITCDADADRFNYLPAACNTFVSIEPLMGDIVSKHNVMFRQVDWIIIGAETGRNKNKIVPELQWIKDIVVKADYNSVPVFMKDSLIPIVGEENMRREFPKQLQHSEISPKLKAKLFDGCASCKAHLRKSEMITLLARSKRGEQPKQFGFMCRDCFKEFCKDLGLDIPELIGLAESVTIGPGDEDE